MAKRALTAALGAATPQPDDPAKPGRAVAQSNALGITVADLDRAMRASLTDIRNKILGRGGFAKDLGLIREKTAQIAPRVMGYYDQLVRQFGVSRLGWVGFARLIDPSVPDHPRKNKAGEEGYQSHSTYYALNYIKQRWNTQLNPERKKGTPGKREPATDFEARLIATLIAFAKDPEVIWTAIKANIEITEKLEKSLRKRVEKTEAILDVRDVLARPLAIGEANIHMMTPHATTIRNLKDRLADVQTQAAGNKGTRKVADVRGGTSRQGMRRAS